MRATNQRHTIDSLFALLLFGVFAACLLLVLLMGARSYQGVANSGAEDRQQRLAMHYIAAKLRHSDVEQQVWTDSFDDAHPEISTLWLAQDIDGYSYCTRIYYYEGYIRELFAEQGVEFEPGDGNQVLAATGLSFATNGELLTVSAADSAGSWDELRLWLRSAGGDVDE